MEYIDGRTVDQLAYMFNMTNIKLLQVLCVVAERLNELHAAGIVHTDFKLDNCIITFD